MRLKKKSVKELRQHELPRSFSLCMYLHDLVRKITFEALVLKFIT